MGPRGKFKPGKGSKGRANKKKGNFKAKPRKTYSLYGNNKDNDKGSRKRKFEHNSNDEIDKRPKTEPKQLPPELSSESEEEEINDLDLLRSTFSNIDNKMKAIDSSDDEEVEEEETKLDSDDGNNDDNDDSIAGSDDSAVEEEEDDDELLDNDEDVKDLDKAETAVEEKEDENVEEEKLDADDIEENEINANDDPFNKHIAYDITENLLETVQTTPVLMDKSELHWPHLRKLAVQIPKTDNDKNTLNLISLAEDQKFAPIVKPPERIHVSKTNLADLFIKPQIAKHVSTGNKSLSSRAKEEPLPLTPFQAELFSVLNNYQDLLYTERTFSNEEEIRFTYCLHAMNHVLKTRRKILSHNAKLEPRKEVPEIFRDQGLIRPKVLIIAPFKSSALKIINTLVDLFVPNEKGHIINRKKFESDYTGNELFMPKTRPKPEDYELLFNGNVSDDFKMGITINKNSIKLYSNFYSSDIIVASPLGLRYILGAEGEKDRDYDFLASIEFLVIDQAEVFLMQNWDHLLHIMDHLHLQPKDSHGTDFSRVRTWCLNGWSKYYRQTCIFSSTLLPEINSIFNKKCYNYAGKVRSQNPIEYGCIRKVFLQLPHVFHKFNTNSAMDSIDARFNFFVKNILTQQRDPMMKQTLIYVSNYFDYVRLRNYFKKEDLSFVQICEYSKEGKVARARDIFFHADKHFMLYTERYHFFNRNKIKGIRHLVFYQPPNNPHFYYEMVNLMQEANQYKKAGSTADMTVSVIYSKYDALQLASVVGTERAMKMISSDKNVHMLLTDG